MHQTAGARVRIVSWLIAVPALVSAIGLAAIEGGAIMRPTPRFSAEGSFVDAIRDQSPERAYSFVRAGHDPNALITFRHPTLTGGVDVSVSPIVLAVASNNENVVLMLLGFGVRMELPGNSRAACLARRLGHATLAETIERYGGPVPDVPCPELPATPQPLLLPFLSAPAP